MKLHLTLTRLKLYLCEGNDSKMWNSGLKHWWYLKKKKLEEIGKTQS